jgi:hypothetical protein
MCSSRAPAFESAADELDAVLAPRFSHAKKRIWWGSRFPSDLTIMNGRAAPLARRRKRSVGCDGLTWSNRGGSLRLSLNRQQPWVTYHPSPSSIGLYYVRGWAGGFAAYGAINTVSRIGIYFPTANSTALRRQRGRGRGRIFYRRGAGEPIGTRASSIYLIWN